MIHTHVYKDGRIIISLFLNTCINSELTASCAIFLVNGYYSVFYDSVTECDLLCLGGRSHEAYSSRVVCVCVCVSFCPLPA